MIGAIVAFVGVFWIFTSGGASPGGDGDDDAGVVLLGFLCFGLFAVCVGAITGHWIEAKLRGPT